MLTCFFLIGHHVHYPLQIDVPVCLLEYLLPGHIGTQHAVVEISVDFLRGGINVDVRILTIAGIGIEHIHPRQFA